MSRDGARVARMAMDSWSLDYSLGCGEVANDDR